MQSLDPWRTARWGRISFLWSTEMHPHCLSVKMAITKRGPPFPLPCSWTWSMNGRNPPRAPWAAGSPPFLPGEEGSSTPPLPRRPELRTQCSSSLQRDCVIFLTSMFNLQCCVGFCHTTPWSRHGCTYVPSPMSSPPSHPRRIPLGYHRAPGWAPCVIQRLLTSYLSHLVVFICQCYALNSSLLQRLSIVLNWMNGQEVWELWIGFSDHHPEYSSVMGSFNVNSVVSDSLLPRGPQPSRPLCPWDSPGKNTGVGCHALLQGIFPTQGSNPGLPHPRWILYQLSHQGNPFNFNKLSQV